MAYDQITLAGATSQLIEVLLRDSSTGQGKSGIAAASVTAYYIREGGSANSSMTLDGTMTLGTWKTLGWVAVDATNQPGLYQFGIPNAAIASGANGVTFTFRASGAIDARVRIILVAADFRDAVHLGITGIPNAAAGAVGGLPLGADSSGRVDVLKINGTSQTARDIGASVLLSAGTGTGQLDFTSGVVKANLAQILGTALTETAGQLAGGFKKFFNVTTPVHTVASVDQTGDSFARIGANGASLTAVPASGDFTSTQKTSLNAATPSVTVSDKTGFSLAVTPPTAAQVAVAVVDQTLSGHTTAGTVGGGINAAGSAGDPWTTLLPGSYGAGSAGNIIGNRLDAQVSGVAAAVWAVSTRTLSSFGTLVADMATAVWAAATRALTDKTGYALTSAYDAAKTAGDATAASQSTILAAIPTANATADAVLKRDWSGMTGEAAHSVLNALRLLRNKWTVASGVMTVTKEDGATAAWSATVSTDPAAQPVTGNTPTT